MFKAVSTIFISLELMLVHTVSPKKGVPNDHKVIVVKLHDHGTTTHTWYSAVLVLVNISAILQL